MGFGIYDFVYLKNQTNKSKTIDLDEEFKKLFEGDDKINRDENGDKFFHYFDTKNLLIRVSNEIENRIYKVKRGDFTLITNIELKKIEHNPSDSNTISMSGYRDLNKAIYEIRCILNSYLDSFRKANIYKSLGPKDLTLIIEDSSIDSLYEIINTILKESDEVNRTFTIFATKDISGEVEGEYSISSYLRVLKEKRQDIEKLKETILSKDDRILEITGVMDYKIEWSSIKNIDTLFKKYDSIISYISDYQTKIDKIY